MDGLGHLQLALALALLTPALAGCGTSSDLDAGDQKVKDEWQNARPSSDERGAPAELDLRGDPIVATGEFEADPLQAPLTLEPAPLFPDRQRFVFFGQAEIDDGSQGLVVLEGETVQASDGSLEAFPVERVRADDGGVQLGPVHERPDIDDDGWAWPEAWSNADRALFFADTTHAEVRDVRLDGFERGLLVTENESRPLEAPVRLSAQSIAWDANATASVDEVRLDVRELAVASNGTRGHADAEGRERLEDPEAIFGHGGEIRAEPGRIASSQPVRLTQALADGTPQWRSDVEIHATSEAIAVERGETAWLPVLYREASGEADALMDNATVTGDAKRLVTVPVEKPPMIVEKLWDAVFDHPGSALVAGIPVAMASPFLVMAEALSCLTGCPENSPYPSWIDAGEVGTFYVKVEGEAPPGDYESSITIEGQNYDPVDFPLAVTVQPDEAQAS